MAAALLQGSCFALAPASAMARYDAHVRVHGSELSRACPHARTGHRGLRALLRRLQPLSTGLTYELVLEWTYAIGLGRRLTIQPDVQYVINPGGVSSVGNAVVLGTQIAIEF